MDDIKTSPLRTATPETAMNPTAAEIENGMPRSAMAKMPPAYASGTAVKTIRANGMFPRAIYKAPKIDTMQTGKTTSSRRIAC
jgi:hypothetical protein